jgi:peroxiredoxin
MNKKMVKTSLILLWLMFFQSACGVSASSSNNDVGISPQVGYLAPDFSLRTPDGSSIRLSDLRGYGVFINFWATWCGPCQNEMPDIQSIHESYSGQGLIVLSVNQEDTASDVTDYANWMGMTFPIVLDSSAKVGETYLVWDIPYSYFVDKNGIIQSIYIGQMSRDEMEERVWLVLP